MPFNNTTLNDNDRRVLAAIPHPRFTRRTAASIAKTAGLSVEETTAILEDEKHALYIKNNRPAPVAPAPEPAPAPAEPLLDEDNEQEEDEAESAPVPPPPAPPVLYTFDFQKFFIARCD